MTGVGGSPVGPQKAGGWGDNGAAVRFSQHLLTAAAAAAVSQSGSGEGGAPANNLHLPAGHSGVFLASPGLQPPSWILPETREPPTLVTDSRERASATSLLSDAEKIYVYSENKMGG